MKTKQTDFDSPWKVVIEQFFPQFMAFFFPKVYVQIDWEKGYTFLDKELQQVTRDAEIGPRRVDKLVKVWWKDGAEVWIYIHLEILLLFVHFLYLH